MSHRITDNAVSDNFVIDMLHNNAESQVTVKIHPDCTGTIHAYMTDDTVETLELVLQHDGATCPVHEMPPVIHNGDGSYTANFEITFDALAGGEARRKAVQMSEKIETLFPFVTSVSRG